MSESEDDEVISKSDSESYEDIDTIDVFLIGNSEFIHDFSSCDQVIFGDRELQCEITAISDDPDFDSLEKLTKGFKRLLNDWPEGYHAFFLIINVKNLKVKDELQILSIYKEILGTEFFTEFGYILISGDEIKEKSCFDDKDRDFNELTKECSNRVLIYKKGENNSLQLTEAKQQSHEESILGNNLERYTKVMYDKNESKRTRLLNKYRKNVIELEFILKQSDITDKIEKVIESKNKEDEKMQSLGKILIEVNELLNTIENHEFKDLNNVKESVLKTQSTVYSYIDMLKPKTSKKRHLDFVLLGKTGSGKSATGNSILLRNDAFEFSGMFTSVTKKPQYQVGEFEDCIIQVVDAPGVGDTDLSERKGIELVTSCIQQAVFANPIGYHAFLIIIKYGSRYTREEEKAIETLKNILGGDFIKKHGIMIISGGDNFEREQKRAKEKISFETFCTYITGPLKELMHECNNRVLLFDNATEDSSLKHEQVKKLVQMVDKLSSEGKRYTNKQFLAANESRKKAILESSKNLIEKETLLEQDLILQSIRKAKSFPDSKSKVQLFNDVLKRIDALMETLTVKDKGTGVLHKIVENIQETKKVVESEIEFVRKIIKQKKEERTKQERIIKESEDKMRLQKEELKKELKRKEELIRKEMIEKEEMMKKEKEDNARKMKEEKQQFLLENQKKEKEINDLLEKEKKSDAEVRRLQKGENEKLAAAEQRRKEDELKSNEREKMAREMEKRIKEKQEKMEKKLRELEEESKKKAEDEIKKLQEKNENERRKMEDEIDRKRQILQEQLKTIKEENDDNILKKILKWVKSVFR